MADRDSTTGMDKETLIKMEALAAIQNVKMVLSGLAAIAVLKIQAAQESEGSNLPPHFWRELYSASPWTLDGEIATPGELPGGLEEGLNRIIFKEASQAWNELFEKAERMFGPETYGLQAREVEKEGGGE